MIKNAYFLFKLIPGHKAFFTIKYNYLRRLPTVSNIQGVSKKKMLWKFSRQLCIINMARQFNFYIGRMNSYLAFQLYSF